jgi:hypothetical protein
MLISWVIDWWFQFGLMVSFDLFSKPSRVVKGKYAPFLATLLSRYLRSTPMYDIKDLLVKVAAKAKVID